jgi:hypothetical protein
MNKIKKGDNIITTQRVERVCGSVNKGVAGVIDEINGDGTYWVKFPGRARTMKMRYDEMEQVKETGMTQLGERNYQLISDAMKTVGFNDPDETLEYSFESFYCNEWETIKSFIHWLHKSGRPFGSGNYEDRFSEYLKEGK